MATRHPDDALFDNNKYFFPDGTAPFRKQAHQPGLEVPAERDEQGIPGLQLVPTEQKFAYHDAQGQGLYGGYSAPIPPEPAAYLNETISHNIQPVQIEQRQWVQPVGIEEHSLSQLATSEQGHHPNQTFWAQSNPDYGYYGQPEAGPPSQYAYHSHSSLVATSQFDGRSAWTQISESRLAGSTLGGSQDFPLMKENAATSSLRREPNKRRKWWIAGGILALFIVIGVILGAVLGTQSVRKDDSSAVIPLASDNATSLKTIRPTSRLATTGYRGDNGDYTLRLFFQDPDNNIRFMDKTSSNNAWTDPVTLETLEHQPMPNGSITAGYYMGGDPDLIEFFYLDTASTIRGQVFNFQNDDIVLKGQGSSINDYPLKVADNSSISTYFPYIVSQDTDNKLRWTMMLGQNGSNLTQPWWVNDTDLNVVGAKGTDLTLLPVAQTYLDDGGFIYRTDEGRLATAIKDYTGNATTDASWSRGFLSTPIPADSAIGAFVVGRPYTPEDVNTYILYQDDAGVIQVVWQDGDEWQGPETYDAFDNAETGTDIECLTQGASDSMHVQVSREQDMNRCFFQEKGTGRLKEVWFDGSDWKDEGFVPLD
ncbi:hypothetical protein BJ170DRAFT_677953 [Xylariales sp. AK1849]|nr:hypothetical protein BJ170DRAFT_677953 [Xylariales sp. AK1849]